MKRLRVIGLVKFWMRKKELFSPFEVERKKPRLRATEGKAESYSYKLIIIIMERTPTPVCLFVLFPCA